ncbi:hypothetical protein Q7P37_011203 [Cladosporium fusiforme]
MANGWSLLVSIIFIVVFCAVAWFASPKGENQTYVSSHPLLSTSLSCLSEMLSRSPKATSLTSYQRLALDTHPLRLELLAHVGYASTPRDISLEGTTRSNKSTAITFLAQWHPLIMPQRNDLRPEYNGGPVKSPSFM